MPALLFVILVTTLAFSLIMLPQDLVKYYKSVIWVVAYVGNFFFWREYGGYFDGGSQEVPLLHTWSLAVEEQYYFIWPIMLMVAYKYLGNKGTIISSIVLCFLAVLLSQWGTEVTIGAAYYLLPTRFFELMVGSCLSLSWRYLPKYGQTTDHCISIVGIILIIGSAILLDEHSPFPGYNALYPVIGTALIILSSHGIVNKVLSIRPMVFTGNISYSLYLWHWPVLVFFNYTAINLEFLEKILAIAVMYLLAVFSWKFIEQPGRLANVSGFKRISWKFYALPSAVLVCISIVGIHYEGYTNRFDDKILQMEKALNTHSSKSRKACHSTYRQSTLPPHESCVFGKESALSETEVFMFGDSHANHFVPFIKTLISDAGLYGQDYTLDRCLPIFGLNWGSNLHKAELCQKRNLQARSYIEKNQFKYVILAASWPDYSTRRIFTDVRVKEASIVENIFVSKLTETLSLITSTGATPVIIANTPTLGGKNPKCAIQNKIFNGDLDCDIQFEKNVLLSLTIEKLITKFPNLIVIKPHELMCVDQKCLMSLKDIPLYRDNDHLNGIGSKILAEIYLKEHDNPFISKAFETNFILH